MARSFKAHLKESAQLQKIKEAILKLRQRLESKIQDSAKQGAEHDMTSNLHNDKLHYQNY